MTADYEGAAKRLRAAYKSGAISPLRDVLDPTDAQGAYAIQEANTDYWLGSGRKITGRKIGLTARAVQLQLGVDQPDYGVLFADMEIPNGGTLSSAEVIQPKAEAEVALVLASDLLDEECSLSDLVAAVDFVLPAIEIVDSRIAEWKITFADTVADNGSSAFYVLGNRPVSLTNLDLLTCGMVLKQNGVIASVGAGGACLGHPLNAALWLARTMAKAGTPLCRGEVILTGALGPMITLKPGDHVETQIGGIGTVSFYYD